MKNIHLIPTDKPSRLCLSNNSLTIIEEANYTFSHIQSLHIYITSDEEIKANVYCLINGVLCKTELLNNKIVSRQLVGGATMDICKSEYSEIILTTDQSLDGIQSIDNDFLEWFVKNPSCKWVEIDKNWNYPLDKSWEYKIIIPKKETIEQAAKT